MLVQLAERKETTAAVYARSFLQLRCDLLQKLARRADHQLERAMAASGARQAHLSKKANRTLERLRAAADRAETQGTLGVPVGPIDADVGSFVSLERSP